MSSLVYLLPFGAPAAIVIGFAYGVAWPSSLVYGIFVAATLLDTVVPASIGRTPALRDNRSGDLLRRTVTWLWVPTHVTVVLVAMALVSRDSTTLQETASTSIAIGMIGGMLGVPVAHELMHGRRLERAGGELLMVLLGYPHFSVEHVRGHHTRVATPNDPATARCGESLYAFLPRSVFGGLTSAWAAEAGRLRARRRSVVSLRNQTLRGLVALVLLYLVIGAVFGSRGAALFAVQSAVAILVLETINYVQHYGLVRGQLAPQRYEPVTVMHSWNSGHVVSNWFLLNLGHHSDHHCDAAKGYLDLADAPGVPQLPTGLFGMFVLALFPPLFRAIMDPLVEDVRLRSTEPATAPALQT